MALVPQRSAPLRQLLEILGKRVEPAHRPAVGVVRDRDVSRPAPLKMPAAHIRSTGWSSKQNPFLRFSGWAMGLGTGLCQGLTEPPRIRFTSAANNRGMTRARLGCRFLPGIGTQWAVPLLWVETAQNGAGVGCPVRGAGVLLFLAAKRVRAVPLLLGNSGRKRRIREQQLVDFGLMKYVSG